MIGIRKPGGLWSGAKKMSRSGRPWPELPWILTSRKADLAMDETEIRKVK
jgi:hypothetical protein